MSTTTSPDTANGAAKTRSGAFPASLGVDPQRSPLSVISRPSHGWTGKPGLQAARRRQPWRRSVYHSLPLQPGRGGNPAPHTTFKVRAGVLPLDGVPPHNSALRTESTEPSTVRGELHTLRRTWCFGGLKSSPAYHRPLGPGGSSWCGVSLSGEARAIHARRSLPRASCPAATGGSRPISTVTGR